LIINVFSFIFKETTRKSAESLRKLNDGITLIEQQTDENRRKIEKVLDAEIKSRLVNYSIHILTIQYFYSSKQHHKELADIVTKTDEKLSYQIGTIQSSINNINTRLTDLRDLV
jgi:chaperonin cofactor prefoldin